MSFGQFNKPRNTEKYIWTEHSFFKMKQYGLSAQRVLRVVRFPKRKEEGIVKNTVAVMAPVSSKKIDGKETWKQEIWVMFQTERKTKNIPSLGLGKLKIISAWRYPGVSPKNNPIPEDIIREISENI